MTTRFYIPIEPAANEDPKRPCQWPDDAEARRARRRIQDLARRERSKAPEDTP